MEGHKALCAQPLFKPDEKNFVRSSSSVKYSFDITDLDDFYLF